MVEKRYYENFDKSISEINNYWNTYRYVNVNTEISAEDDMYSASWDSSKLLYLCTGENALCTVAKEALLENTFKINSISNRPCGFGRVIRHLRLAFPQARLYGCDLYENRITYCAEKFGSSPIKSKENFDEIEFPEKFDLIWCGSLLTHLPEPLFKDALRLFSRSLADNGIAIITVLGRISNYIQHNKFPSLQQDSYEIVEKGLNNTGIDNADYHAQDVFNEQDAYRITVVTPSFLMGCLEDDYSVQICGYVENGWTQQQDVVIFKQSPVNCW